MVREAQRRALSLGVGRLRWAAVALAVLLAVAAPCEAHSLRGRAAPAEILPKLLTGSASYEAIVALVAAGLGGGKDLHDAVGGARPATADAVTHEAKGREVAPQDDILRRLLHEGAAAAVALPRVLGEGTTAGRGLQSSASRTPTVSLTPKRTPTTSSSGNVTPSGTQSPSASLAAPSESATSSPSPTPSSTGTPSATGSSSGSGSPPSRASTATIGGSISSPQPAASASTAAGGGGGGAGGSPLTTSSVTSAVSTTTAGASAAAATASDSASALPETPSASASLVTPSDSPFRPPPPASPSPFAPTFEGGVTPLALGLGAAFAACFACGVLRLLVVCAEEARAWERRGYEAVSLVPPSQLGGGGAGGSNSSSSEGTGGDLRQAPDVALVVERALASLTERGVVDAAASAAVAAAAAAAAPVPPLQPDGAPPDYDEPGPRSRRYDANAGYGGSVMSGYGGYASGGGGGEGRGGWTGRNAVSASSAASNGFLDASRRGSSSAASVTSAPRLRGAGGAATSASATGRGRLPPLPSQLPLGAAVPRSGRGGLPSRGGPPMLLTPVNLGGGGYEGGGGGRGVRYNAWGEVTDAPSDEDGDGVDGSLDRASVSSVESRM